MKTRLQNFLFLFSLLLLFSSCGDSNNTPAPAPAPVTTPTVFKIQAKVGDLAGVNASVPLGDDATVELNPNLLTKLAVEFTILEDTTVKTSDVTFSVKPVLSSVEGVTVTNTGGIHKITISPENYTIDTDKAYVLLAKMGTVEKFRNFTIKGKSASIPLVSLSLARITGQESVTATVGGATVDLKTIFSITFVPENATNKSVIWSVDSESTVASWTSEGILNPLSAGIANIKITSVENSEISSSNSPFTINPVENTVLINSLSLERKANQINTKARIGKTINLLDIFDINFEPANTTDKIVTWSIVPPNPTVATVTDAGLLTPLGIGKVYLKITSVSTKVFSTRVPLDILSAFVLEAMISESIISSLNPNNSVDIDTTPEIDPNNADKLVGIFVLEDEVNRFISDIQYVVTPKLPNGIKIENSPFTNQLYTDNNHPIVVKIDPVTYKVLTDVTYTLTATNGTGFSHSSLSRTFIIKGNSSIYATNIALTLKENQVPVKSSVSEVDITSRFTVSYTPENTNKKDLKWSISPPKPKIARINEQGLLKVFSAGEITIKVNYVANLDLEASASYTIAPATTNKPVTRLTLTKKSDKENTNARVGVSNLDLNTFYDITVVPTDASNKSVNWSIDPPQDTVATITSDGVLTAKTAGTIMLKVTSVSQTSISSTAVELVLADIAVMKALLTTLSGYTNLLLRLTTEPIDILNNLAVDDSEVVELLTTGPELGILYWVLIRNRLVPTGVSYSISPDISLNDAIISIPALGFTYVYMDRASFKSTNDITYSITVSGTALTTPRIRSFKIKGLTKVPVTGITVAKKTNQENTKGLKGLSIDLNNIFDITVAPINASDKNVTWAIDPPKPTIATITDSGVLKALSAGSIMLKVTSVSENTISSTKFEFVIEDSKTLELAGNLPTHATGSDKYNVAWLLNGEEYYNAGVVEFNSAGKYIMKGIPVDKIIVDTKFIVTVEKASSKNSVSYFTYPNPREFKLLEIAIKKIEGSVNVVSKFHNQDTPTVNQTFILATPSDAVSTNEKSGVWFKKAATTPAAGLTLPALTDEYSYEGWVVIGTGDAAKKLSTGKFKDPSIADNGKYYYSGNGPAFPGEDFLTNPTVGTRKIENLKMPISPPYKVIITIEPTTETGIDETTPSNIVIYEKNVSASETTGRDKVLLKGDLLKVQLKLVTD